ncbi:DUF3817 domain-containing protein [Celeribacter sp. SCSIO 80788]|uniref:DUF3817 domain-containing protein n=1 Tax=Celeribacter sp. SCSIO 80788 TaxID=3117013 RepID=UPI003DA4AF74
MTQTPAPQNKRLFSLFRVIALIEGVTTILLFFVAMPIKYGLENPSWVKVMGPVHGYAFLAYIALMLIVMRGIGWQGRDKGRAFVASLVPLGTFINDPFLKRRGVEVYGR